MQKEITLTPEGRTRLEEELRELETTRRKEIGERIKEAKEFGDISENSEYDDAKNEQAMVENRIAELTRILASATVVERATSDETIQVGSSAKLILIRTDKLKKPDTEITVTIVGSVDADPLSGRISADTPVGQALLGARYGDEITVHIEREALDESIGGTLVYRVDHPDEAAAPRVAAGAKKRKNG